MSRILANWAIAEILTAIAALLIIGCGKTDSKPSAGKFSSGAEPIANLQALDSTIVHSEPLGPRANVSAPLFQRVPPDQSGLNFVHRWEPANNSDRDLIATAFAGGGVALGDIDHDGLPEVFLTRPHGGARLYKNLGDFKFQDITADVGIEKTLAEHWAAGATFVDIQGDGHLDLYVCGYRSRNKLFINTGEGTFVERAEEYGLAFSGASVMMSFADYDHDGDLDAFLLTNRLSGQPRPAGVEFQIADGKAIAPEPYRDEVGAIVRKDGSLYPYDAGQADRLYRNDSTATKPKFTEVTKQAGIGGHFQGLSATWWDYDSDGWIDLYVANDFFGPDHLYRNNSDGTFTDVIATTVPHTPWFSMGSDAGDLNGDGQLDFIAADMAATTHYKQKVNMGDMDAEGWFLEHGSPRQYMRNAVFINTETPRFMEVAHMTGLAATDWTWAVKIVDFDCDGWNDVFFSNGMTRDFFHADLRNEVREIRNRTGENRWSDYPVLAEQNRLFKNQGEVAFEDVSQSCGIDGKTVSFGAAAGDLDGDGDPDLIVNNFQEAVSLFRNASHENNLIKVSLQSSSTNVSGIGAELRIKAGGAEQVRVLQPVRGFFGCDPSEAVFGIGDATVVDELLVRWPTGNHQVVRNLACGHHYLIQETDSRSQNSEPAELEPLFSELKLPNQMRHVEQDFDDFALQPLLPNRLSTAGPAMAWGDIDGNGKVDCFLGGACGQPAQLWLQSDEKKLFRQRIPFFVDHQLCEDTDAALFDADGDGDLDLYVVSGGVEGNEGSDQYRDRLYLSVENGLSVAPDDALPDMNFSGSCVAVGDCDNDGDYDLFVGARVIPGQYPSSVPSRLLINQGHAAGESVRFEDAPPEVAAALSVPVMVTDAIWSDADSDGDLDLLVTTEYGPVKYFRNDNGVFVDATSAAGLAGRLGWWNCIAAADIDADGDIDYAVGNFGLNTKYHATAQNPQLLYAGDFDGSGKTHCVEAHGSDGTLVPNRGRSCSSGAMPFIADKYKNFHSFATADLADIYSTEKLQASTRLEANELASGILLNDGSGRFEFRALPRLAQVAPCFGLAFLDANGDGKKDLYVSQNFYGPQRETGRMAGGVGMLLLGHGDGSFTDVSANRSGIVIPDDARGVSVIDFNGDGADDIAVAVNNGKVRLLQNRKRD
ncbi:MAG: VCBS repeat-containing protein [Planctomycetales bacterium]|nr:VCBS repeat-containing protein [Planctomycetales bacterium]